MQDDLGDRIKRDYENRTRYSLPRRTYTIFRVDGKNFHTYTRGLTRPFDPGLMADMDKTAVALCENITGSVFAYVQSDEISLLVTDFAVAGTEAWFDGNIQKMSSISASLATVAFNRARWERELQATKDSPAVATFQTLRDACFDARVFTIPDPVEVENYFIWRQQDAARNSFTMAASTVYSPEELHGKKLDAMQEMLWQRGINWNNYPAGFKRGRLIRRANREQETTYTHSETGQTAIACALRSFWEVDIPPVFTRERDYLTVKIPRYL